jgi:hypothetical protein
LAWLGALVSAATVLAVVIIVLGIVFVLTNANPGNEIVHGIRQAAAWLTTPFANMFTARDGTSRLAWNWGVAAAVYLVAGTLLARVLRRL